MEYPCFISYRHGQGKLLSRIITDLQTALEAELEAMVGVKPFLDRERLKGGDFYNPALAYALCQSACMVMVYTPPYFDPQHSYCAREFQAMERLEAARLKLLGLPVEQCGLIIPIVFRGSQFLPDAIKKKRQYYDFQKFLLSDTEIYRHPEYAPKIREVAEVVTDRYNRLAAVPVPCNDCTKFCLPSPDEVAEWLQAIRVPFPLRQAA